MGEIRTQFKMMNRQFGLYMKHKTATLLTALLAVTAIRNWLILPTWHITCVHEMHLDAFIYHYRNWNKHKKYNFSKSRAEEIYVKAKELVPVLSKDELNQTYH